MTEEQVFDVLTPEEQKILAQYISDPEGDVFVVKLPGMAGATYARYSRAKSSWKKTFLKEFVSEGNIDPARADNLIKQVLIGYGDDSVGELDGAHLSLENISNLATKAVEDSRIGVAYIEQSSRYVVYDQKDTQGRYRYLQDPQKNPIITSAHRDAFVNGMNHVFDIYCSIVKRLQDHLKKVKLLSEAEYAIKDVPVKIAQLTDNDDILAFKRSYTRDIRSKACDIARVLLPASTLTNVGLFCNGRAYQNMLTRLYSSDLPELQILAKQSHEALNHVIKQYVARAKRDEYLVEINKNMQTLADELLKDIPVNPEEDVVLLDDKEDYKIGMIAYMLYKYAEHPMRQIREIVHSLSEEKQDHIISTYVGNRKHRRNKSGRALEYGYPLFFDILADFGIFRDLHRQRMLTMERQRLSTRHSFVQLHPMLETIGAQSEVKECIDISSNLYEKIRTDLGRDVAQYPVLFGFNIRFAQGFNDRQAQFYLELRTGKQGHPSYRAVCQKMHKLIEQRAPWRAKMMQFVDHHDYFWSRAESEASQRRKEHKLGIKQEEES